MVPLMVRTFRSWGTVSFGATAIAAIAALGAWTLLTAPSDIGGALLVGWTLAVLQWGIWTASVAPAVRLTRTDLLIDNPVLGVVVPWSRIAGVDELGGRVVVRVDDGRVFTPWIASGSLLGAMFGSRSARRLARELRAAVKAARPGDQGAPVRRRVRLQLGFLAVTGAFYTVVALVAAR